MNLRNFLVALSLSVITSLLLVGCEQEANQQQVDVAANLPITGDLSVYGSPVQEGARMALSDLESDTSTGPKIVFDWQDNQGDPNRTVSVMQQQLLDSPDIYTSGVKPQTMAIESQIESEGLPHFVWIFDVKVNKSGNNNFRTWVSFKNDTQAYLEYAKEVDPERAFIVYVKLPHTQEAYEERLAPALRNQGVSEVKVESFGTDLRDFKTLAQKIQAFGPDFIVLNGFQSDLVSLIRAMRPLGLIENGNTIAAYDMLDAANSLGPEELEGIRVTAPNFTLYPDQGRVSEWRDRFEDRYGKEPFYTHAYAYDMVQIIHNAGTRLDLPASSEEWIQAIGNTDMQGITGPLQFDEDGSLITPIGVGVYRDGELVPDTSVTVPLEPHAADSE